MRGQAFEVFRLLIAAVVAGAVLMVLLNVLNVIKPPSTDPGDAIKTLVQKYYNQGSGGGTQDVEFQSGTIIEVGGIGNAIGIGAENVCVKQSIDVFSSYVQMCGHSGIVCNESSGTIQYTGRTRLKAKVAVYCADGVCGNSGIVQCAVTVVR